MNERYSRLSTLPNNLYTNGAPVLISAGALLKDNQSDKVLVQLKITNLSPSIITACKVSIKAYDPSGEALQGVENYSYLDINVSRGKPFGTKKPIDLPDRATRKIIPYITDVVFADGTVWKHGLTEWKPLPPQMALSSILPDVELQRQYYDKIGGDCEYAPMIAGDLFLCACGTVNSRAADHCSKCNRSFDMLMESLDLNMLSKDKEARLEREAKEKIESDQIAAEKRLKRNKDIKRATGISAIVAIIIAAVFLSARMLSPIIKYNKADKLFQDEKYSEAIAAFAELGDYKDSAEKIEICKNEQIYRQAIQASESGDVRRAAELYESLNGYKDSIAQREALNSALEDLKMDEFLQSDLYKSIIDAMKNQEFVDLNADTEFDRDDHSINVFWHAPSGTYEGMRDIDPDELVVWDELCDDLAKTTREAKKKLDAEVYPYKVTISLLSDIDSTPMIKCVDGEVEYNCVDMQDAYDKALETIYKAVVEYIDAGEYSSAKSYWEQSNYNGYYSINYKDLSNYLDYAGIMLTVNSRLPQEVISNVEALEKLPSTFSLKGEILNTLKSMAMLYKAVEGTYEGVPDRQIGLHRYVVSGDEILSNVQSVFNGEWAVKTEVHFADIIDAQISGNSVTYSIKDSKGFRKMLTAIVTDGTCDSIKIKDDPMFASDISGTYIRKS